MVWLVASGCAQPKPIGSIQIPNRTIGPAVVAVAPAINLSGSLDFDPNRFADLMAVELAFADGIRVIPVSRVLGVLAIQGKERVESPSHAGELINWLGADALLVFAVTEYAPYDPPRIGISAQMFVVQEDRKPSPQNADEPEIESPDVVERPVRTVRTVAEHQRVYDASHADVLRRVQMYAAPRSADDSPYGWRKFVVSQEGFIRFCGHETVAAMLAGRIREGDTPWN